VTHGVTNVEHPLPVDRRSEDQVVCVGPAGAAGNRGTFGRDASGAVSWVRFGLRVYNRQLV
jgi:hypothetical protein